MSYTSTPGKRIWSWVEESVSQVAVSALEHHPFSVGLGVFDMGFDNGCGLFRSVSWAGSPRALPFPALLYSFSSEYLVPKCQLPVFTSYCYPWLPRMLKLEWALWRALQMKARLAVSPQWGQNWARSVRRKRQLLEDKWCLVSAHWIR